MAFQAIFPPRRRFKGNFYHNFPASVNCKKIIEAVTQKILGFPNEPSNPTVTQSNYLSSQSDTDYVAVLCTNYLILRVVW